MQILKLSEILNYPPSAVSAIGTLIQNRLCQIDATGVERIPADVLALLFPSSLSVADIELLFLPATISPTLREQLQPLDTQASAPSAPSPKLDIFELRQAVIDNYASYIKSFLKIRDSRLKEFVEAEIDKGFLWSPPLIQLNPAYKRGRTVSQLVRDGVLHADCDRYFRSKYSQPFHFYEHQEKAFLLAQKHQHFVVTTGTGSGKSLTYIVPIIDDLSRNRDLRGVRAILVYPMNALINSQLEEIKKFLSNVPDSHITVARYTGQESLAEKNRLQNEPPHILLTNYVMLELMLSRVHEHRLVTSPHLKFLILDELHTYRGRQGADVALLVRKLRHRSKQNLICIGTSATMASEGTIEERRKVVAEVASKLFGVEVPVSNVIDETLVKSINRPSPSQTELVTAVTDCAKEVPSQDLDTYKRHPLVAWMEENIGLETIGGKFIRRKPTTLEMSAKILAEQTGLDISTCESALQNVLLWGSKVGGLAFRVHQFISQGGSVYATLEPPDRRELTLEGKYRTTNDRLLFPLVFCRECGQEYYMVRREGNECIKPLSAEALTEEEMTRDDVIDGYIALDRPHLWTEEDEEQLPDNWFTQSKKGQHIPEDIWVTPDGKITRPYSSDAVKCWFIAKPFLLCLECGVVYDKRTGEFSKLARLSSEGRSTATTLISLTAIRQLKEQTKAGILQPEGAKILSFTDNRQDASLQAGHFNDFVMTFRLRAALRSALAKHGVLRHENIVNKVVDELQLQQEDYAITPAEGIGAKRNQEALHHYIEYLLYEDLRRGWRIVQPNLEQAGLLRVEYEGLMEMCANSDCWVKYEHPVLLKATTEQRYRVCCIFLDRLRRQLVIDAANMQEQQIEELKRKVNQALKEPWCFDENTELRSAGWAALTPDKSKNVTIKLSARSRLGLFLRSARAWNWLEERLPEDDYNRLIQKLIQALIKYGYLRPHPHNSWQVQLKVNTLLWRGQEVSEIEPDPLNAKYLDSDRERNILVNSFFQNFYKTNPTEIATVQGREHTGQVSTEQRQQREESFRKGHLSALFCSPTMELGIDIADLSVVHMRNVPPNPANYAQRSGRAGRGGQGALVVTYAAALSNHDQYFYRRQIDMVFGAVSPPQLDLSNPDLIISHIHSVWLAYTGVSLGESMAQLLDLQDPDLPIRQEIWLKLHLSESEQRKCLAELVSIFQDQFAQQDLKRHKFFNEQWLSHVLANSPNQLHIACDRWRELYKTAIMQRDAARKLIDQVGISPQERRDAELQEKEAITQIRRLTGEVEGNKSDLEFYPYRYLAEEGFLPGFNFPRIPVRACLKSRDQSEFINRGKVVAITEFAPDNIIYHEGKRYKVSRIRLPLDGVEKAYQRMAVCPNCGYFHVREEYDRDTCINCGGALSQTSSEYETKLLRVLTMTAVEAKSRERVTCDEEERARQGYYTTTHYRYGQERKVGLVLNSGGKELLRLEFAPAAQIMRVNHGARRSRERGFRIDSQTGEVCTQESKARATMHTGVYLAVEETSNLMLCQPLQLPKKESNKFVTTLQYALERAIQNYYKLELGELSSELVGSGNYVLFWEAAEGGAGVLAQLMDDSLSISKIAQSALEICHFVDTKDIKDSCTYACYECLLSYNNQLAHHLINRHLVRDFLQELIKSHIQLVADESPTDREKHFQALLQQTHPDSELERQVLRYIYDRGYPLPDYCQKLIPGAYVTPDFLYEQERLCIFCDGAIHDMPDQTEKDKRDQLKLEEDGYTVIRLRYDRDWQTVLDNLFGQGV
ncbi:MAG: DEAD/DEAH box helicase [Pseudanabaenaceae cyanobacterium SKYGB_i_bin29]|nr:DEAD/DEAH box helicase [Pseudanabaenaceae cyanobacterium SKYG29]MDW8420812.1 DEAD/DEAH box helicase [Pseudanabaenaceae cyanobacterium SKYGB_i_bin29]